MAKDGKWRAEKQDDGNSHVFPDDERFFHSLSGTRCPCKPRVTHNFGGRLVVVHRSEDGREYIEDAERIFRDPDAVLKS